jgi:hypothetical protein
MKKISFILACVLVFSVFTTCASSFTALFDESEHCTIDKDGTLAAYNGEYDEVLEISASIGGKAVNKIGDRLFAAKLVNTVYINEGVNEIGKEAFGSSTLVYVDIPSSVKKIGEGAFKDCKKLTSLSIGSDDVEFGKDAFAGTDFLYIAVLCSLDTKALGDKIRNAKGDDKFTFDVMHSNLVESMLEKDIYGNNLIYCEDCGFAYRGYDDIEIPFTDVTRDAWYYPYVVTAYEFGIMNGKSETIFDPNENMTLAEAAKIAACVHLYINGDSEYQFETNTEEWYRPYVDYCYEKGIIDKRIVFEWDKNATRAEMAYLFSRADDGYFVPNEDVPLSDIPDVDENTAFALNILALYRRGIATGSNEYYYFYPDAFLKRSEAATIVSRIICYDMRVYLPKG